MELYWFWMSAATLLACYVFVNKFVRRLNGWYYDLKLGKKQCPLPPGDMGWPLIGNLITFLNDFSSGHPDSFINNLVSKYGRTGIYKTHLLGKPSIIVCTPEMCRRVLNDDENFKQGYPKSTNELLRNKPLTNVSNAEHKGLRELLTSRILGHNVLAMYLERIEETVINSLEELSSMKHPIELFREMEKVSFRAIIHIFMGSHNNQSIMTKLSDLFHEFSNSNPLYSVAINLPGFAFHKGLKVRKKVFKLMLSVVDERRLAMKNSQIEDKKDLIDIILESKGENGENLKDKDIVDILIMLLFAGHETTSVGLTRAIIHLTRHPDVFRKAKEEQEEIVKARPPSQKQLSHKEIKQMVYLSQVINEMLRRTNIAFTLFREATADVNINDYIIPKGWKVLIWLRAIHMNPEYYPNPEEFNPSRWDDYNAKAGTFLPFGAGSRLCPGNQIFKLEISIFLHYFLLNYKLEQISTKYPDAVFPFSNPKDLAKVVMVSMLS